MTREEDRQESIFFVGDFKTNFSSYENLSIGSRYSCEYYNDANSIKDSLKDFLEFLLFIVPFGVLGLIIAFIFVIYMFLTRGFKRTIKILKRIAR